MISQLTNFSFLSLYHQVMIQYFNPSVFRCILLRWVRLLGFAIVYGTVILKLYRYKLCCQLHSKQSCFCWSLHEKKSVGVVYHFYICVLSLFLIPRVLKVFLSRTAQRIPYMTSWRVLRLLAVILLVVVWFLVAWTSAVCQSPDTHHALIDIGFTPEGLQFSMCLLDSWDYMMAAGQFLCLMLYNHNKHWRAKYRQRHT